MSVCGGIGRWSRELRVADCDDTIETGRGSPGPSRGRAGGGGFEVGQYGREGGVIVACSMVNALCAEHWLGRGKREEGRGRGEEAPVKASSGRTRRSMFCGDAASRRTLARAMFSGSLPSSGSNCRQAMRMLREDEDEGLE